MWTCPRCNSQVEPPFTVCRNCGAAASDFAVSASLPSSSATAPTPLPGFPLPEVTPPTPSPLDRALNGAKLGAIWGAFYGTIFAFMMWWIITALTMKGAKSWYDEFPLALLCCAAAGAAITAPIGALLGLIPKRKRSTPANPTLPPAAPPPGMSAKDQK
jgi:hypothetical protein